MNTFAYGSEVALNSYANVLSEDAPPAKSESEYASGSGVEESDAYESEEDVSGSEAEALSDFTPTKAGISGFQNRHKAVRRSLRTPRKSLRIPTLEEYAEHDGIIESSGSEDASVDTPTKRPSRFHLWNPITRQWEFNAAIKDVDDVLSRPRVGVRIPNVPADADGPSAPAIEISVPVTGSKRPHDDVDDAEQRLSKIRLLQVLGYSDSE
jgi:hypothetical protein